MTLEEYIQVKDMNYDEFCDHLKQKYGKAQYDYFRFRTGGYKPGVFAREPKISRTSEGLFAHHVKEDRAILLSVPDVAIRHPREYQSKENIVYCDWMEHLYAHILIAEHPAPNAEEGVGLGGCINYLVPQLNDIFAGYQPGRQWEKTCADKVLTTDGKSNYDCYMVLLSRLKMIFLKTTSCDPDMATYFLCNTAQEEINDPEIRSNLDTVYKDIKNLPTDHCLSPENFMLEGRG